MSQTGRGVIHTEEDYHEALERFQEVFHAREGSIEYDEAGVLALLIEDYEKKKHLIAPLDPISHIKEAMERFDIKQKDLVGEIGSQPIVSQVLNYKRSLSLEMIRKFEEILHIPIQLLAVRYDHLIKP